MNEYFSDFMFARPSFLEGWARLFDFAGSLNVYNSSEDPDVAAQWADWSAVGAAMSEAMGQFAQEHNIQIR